MHPAPSIILFTTLSGAGFGMLAFLGLDVPAPRGWAAFAFFLLAYLLAGGGLIASVFHLGHPERSAKAFSQWRSSWLSREAWAAVITLVLMAVYGAGLVFFDIRLRIFGIPGGLLAISTVFSTSMIYTQMRSVPRWNHWSPPVVFLGYAIVAGALLTGRVDLARALLPLMFALQAFAWIDQDRRERDSETSLATATGLGGIGKVRAFEPPHTGPNYLTQEMVFRVARRHVKVLRIVALVLATVLPTLLLFLPFGQWLIAVAALVHFAGVLIQRWLFFAEARHVVSHYYGR